MDEILQQIYYNTSSAASFSSVDKIFNEAKKKIPDIKRSDVKSWLEKQLVYTLHKSVRKRFKRNPIIAERNNENFQADLVDMKEFKHLNNNYNYILTVIDVFSKKAWTEPLKNKKAQTVEIAMEKVLLKAKPYKLQTDKGKEFENKNFKDLMKKIQHKSFYY